MSTAPTVIKFYFATSTGRIEAEGSKIIYLTNQVAYITAVNSDRNVINAPLSPGSVGRNGDTFVKILQIQKEAIAALTQVWGHKYIVQVGDRGLLSDSPHEG